MDGCALVSTNAGWNLAIGAFPRATGRFETLRSSDGCREVTGQVQQDRCWLRLRPRADRGRARGAGWRSSRRSSASRSITSRSPSSTCTRRGPRPWPEATRVAARGVTTLAHRMLLAVGGARLRSRFRWPAAGRGAAVQGAALLVVVARSSRLALLERRARVLAARGVRRDAPLAAAARVGPRCRRRCSLGAALLGTTAATHAVFFGEDRYHVVVTPVLALLAAAALRSPRRVYGSVPDAAGG